MIFFFQRWAWMNRKLQRKLFWPDDVAGCEKNIYIKCLRDCRNGGQSLVTLAARSKWTEIKCKNYRGQFCTPKAGSAPRSETPNAESHIWGTVLPFLRRAGATCRPLVSMQSHEKDFLCFFSNEMWRSSSIKMNISCNIFPRLLRLHCYTAV